VDEACPGVVVRARCGTRMHTQGGWPKERRCVAELAQEDGSG
jgi:hypothetical protein